MTIKTHNVLGSGLALGLVLAHGCKYRELDPVHCSNNDGDAYCADRFPDGSRRFCEVGVGPCISSASDLGCVSVRPADECYSPCGGRSTIDENGECVVVEESSSGSSSGGTDTEPSTGGSSESSSTGPMPCVSDEECTDPDAPFCGTAGECGTCDTTADPDAACAGVDPSLPLCVGDTCVACTPEVPLICDDQLLLCDAGTNSCIPCTEHAQCGSGACELSVGTCFPEDFVVHVDGDPGAMPMPDYTSISAALNAVADGMHGVIIVHELDGGGSYQTAGMGLTLNNGKTLALLAAPGEGPIVQGTAGNPGLTVSGAGTILYMDGLRLVGNTMGLGLHVDGAFAWVDRSRIVQNSGGGVVAEAGAELTLRNCFVGGSLDDANALEVNSATADVLSSTLGAGTVTAVGLSCASPTEVIVRNSILVSRGNAGTGGLDLTCPEAMVTYSATESLVVGTGNQVVGDLPTAMPSQWFVDYATGDFHLQNDGLTLFADVAQWNNGDPLTDIDGDPRPAVDGTPDYAGADVP